MKVSITGHTKGIGKSLFEIFPDSIGFSRANGYDITNNSDRMRILEESASADIFINNAYADFGQQYLLYELWDLWKDKSKIIVNIGSISSDFAGRITYPYYKYAIHKLALETASIYMSTCRTPCKVICIKPDYVDTPMVDFYKGPKISPDELAILIRDIIVNDKSYLVSSITLLPRGN